MAVKYIVNLSAQEREHLYQITSKGKTTGRIVKRAQILLLADEGHPDETIANMLKVGESTVHRTRQRCVEEQGYFILDSGKGFTCFQPQLCREIVS